MVINMEREIFAFGDSKIQGVPCVAKACEQYDLDGELLTVAEEYDTVVRERYGLHEGTLPASIAASCWNEALNRVEGRLRHERNPDHAEYLDRALGQGKAVREEAF